MELGIWLGVGILIGLGLIAWRFLRAMNKRR